jgi:hypothetical protein
MEFCAIDSHPQCQFEQCLIPEDLLKKIAEEEKCFEDHWVVFSTQSELR